MTKYEFLDELCKKLRLVPPEEAQRLVDFASEAIDDRMEDGMTEEEAVRDLGDMDDLIREVTGAVPEEEPAREKYAAEDPGDRVEKRVYLLDPEGVREVNVTETDGSVTLVPSPDGRIRVRCTEGKGVRYAVSRTNGVVRVEKRAREEWSLGSLFTVRLEGLALTRSAGQRVTVELPALPEAAVTVNTGSGDVHADVRSLKSLKLATGSGDITAEGLRCLESAGFTAHSGDVSLTEVAAEAIAVSTASGDVKAEKLTANALRAELVSGDLCLEEGFIAKKLIVKTVSGDVELGLDAPVRAGSVETTSGDILAELYGEQGDWSLSARSVSGSVKCPAGFEEAEHHLGFRTVSGDIRVKLG